MLMLLLTIATPPDFNAGKRAYQRRDYTTALRELLPLAEHGDARCQYYMGVMYHEGQGVKKDAAVGAKWFRKAAEGLQPLAARGNAEAKYLLGQMYWNGYELATDYQTGLFTEAAELGYPAAQLKLSTIYRDGYAGFKKDQSEANRWLHKAAENGDINAQEHLCEVFLRGGEDHPYDREQAMNWCMKAADQGSGYAERKIGDTYSLCCEGRDLAKALSWYRRAADHGDMWAHFRIGNMFARGEGVPKSRVDALKWYLKAIELSGDVARVELALRVPHEFAYNNRPVRFICAQCNAKPYIVESP
jgi:hypothetical protein